MAKAGARPALETLRMKTAYLQVSICFSAADMPESE